MFYVANKVLTYPCKSILEDVLSRDGVPGPEAFFPITGQHQLIQNILRSNNSSAIDFTIKEIVNSGVKDYSAEKSRPNDDGIERDDATSDITDYYTRLEDIDESFIIKYITDILKGFRFRRDGAKAIQSNIQTFDLWEDEEDGLVSPSDVMEEVYDYTMDDVEEARKKLPYLLKVLFDGSFKYQGSLLSFIIAVKKLENEGVNNIKPNQVCKKGVYRIDLKGNPSTNFVISDNTGNIFRTLFSWSMGEIKDRYYHAAEELVRVCTVLDLDLCKEDATMYTSDVISSAVCQYIMSNEEYLEEYGYANQKIINALSPEEVLNVAKKVTEGDNDYVAEFAIQAQMDDIAVAINIIRTKRANWTENPKRVKEFLKFYKEHVDDKCITSMRCYEVDDGILRNADGIAVVFKMGIVAPGDYALLSTTGNLICYENFSSDYLRYMSVQDYIYYMEAGESGVWEGASV